MELLSARNKSSLQSVPLVLDIIRSKHCPCKCRFSNEKTCVSHGWRAHVNFPGIKW